jgi:hypothetical protein
LTHSRRDLDAINRRIQERLRSTGLYKVTAVEAARWLDAAGLLKDSQHRSGLPLRNLLRADLIKGQRQEANGRWFIDRVSPDATPAAMAATGQNPPAPRKPAADEETNQQDSDPEESAPDVWYERLRQQYKPQVLQILLIAESPPDPGSGVRRFFYAPDLTLDNLYRGVAEAVYGLEPDFDVRKKIEG